jgi:predicted DNA-binding transcriptional regulator AlpA
MDSRIHRRPTRRERITTRARPFGGQGGGVNDVSSVDSLWTIEDAALYLGVPVKTLYQWKWRGEGPPVRKIGRHLRYDPVEVRTWFAGLGSEAA